MPIVKEIKKDINSVKRELTSLNETVSNLSGNLEQHKKGVESTSELMRGDLTSVKRKLKRLDESVGHLNGDLEQHKNQITSVLADLQSFINMSHTELLTLIHNDMEFELMMYNKTCVKDKLESEIKQNRTHQVNNSDENTPPLPIHTCNGTGGWRRAVYLDMTDPNTNCPEGWNMTDYSKRTCGRATNGRNTCDSVTFSVRGGEYSQVCGRIRAYQWGYTGGFYGYRIGQTTVDEAYFTGVAVLHGSPRQHIWSFVAGLRENDPEVTGTFLCPCDNSYFGYVIPPFIGEDYFCESGYIWPGQFIPKEQYSFHSNDTLWDGRDCHSSSTCCSLHNPPYFTKTLNTPTTDDIELRMCIPHSSTNVAVELVELYVK